MRYAMTQLHNKKLAAPSINSSILTEDGILPEYRNIDDITDNSNDRGGELMALHQKCCNLQLFKNRITGVCNAFNMIQIIHANIEQ